MQRGKKPTPTKLKEIRGNPGKRPLNKNEPKPEITIPKCPTWFGDEATKEWHRITKELYILGLLGEIDRSAISAYCVAYARWVDAEKKLQDIENTIHKTKSGNTITAPLLWVANKANDQMYKWLTEFGMTPSSRSRISVTPPNKDSAFKKFMNG
jgi:P27 family predicted phage terminase small subunit